MSATSVLSVDVDDASFKKFLELFNTYQKQVAAMPAAWAKAGKETDKTAETFSDMTAAMMAQTRLLHEMTQDAARKNRQEDQAAKAERDRIRENASEQEKADRAAKKALDDRKKTHDKIKDDAISTAKSVASTTLNLLKWVNIGGILAGAAGLWGLGSLSNNIAANYRTSSGFGVSTGQMQSLGVNYGRFFDTNSVLGGIANAQSDVTKQWAFGALGINQNGKDPATLAVEAAKAAVKAWTQSGGVVNSGQVQAAMALGFTPEDMRRMKKEGFDNAESSYYRNVKDLTISDKSQKAWTDFNFVLMKTGTRLMNTFGEKLTDLMPKITVLADHFGDLAVKLIKDFKPEWIDAIGRGLDSFAKYIGSDKFQSDVKEFVTDFGAIVTAIANGLKALGIIPPSGGSAGNYTAAPNHSQPFGWMQSPTGNNAATVGTFMANMQAMGWSHVAAAGLASNVEAESAFNPFAPGDFKNGVPQAYGIAQWHPDRQARYTQMWGHTMQSVKDVNQALREQMIFMSAELRTKGWEKDAGDALARQTDATNAGGVVSRQYERNAGGLMEDIRRGNRANVLSKVEVKITNNTGGSASGSASQLPH